MARRITGSVDTTAAGKHRARVPMPDGTRETVGVFDTKKAARLACATIIADLGLDGSEKGVTLRAFAKMRGGFLERRKKARAWKNTETLWATYVETAPFFDRPMKSIRREDVRRWVASIRDRRARQTTLNALYLLSSCFALALDERRVKENPCAGIKLPREARTEETWTFLQRHEPARVEASCTRDEWLMVSFAWGSGLRAGEQRSLLARDVVVDGDDPHVTVRYGSPGKPTKNGKVRRVPLFGVALNAAREWLQRLDAYAPSNPLGLMFPTPSGKARAHSHFLGTVSLKVDGKWVAADRWGCIVDEAGLGRRFRWHDLRHSAASWAVSGWWDGRRWSLAEVRDLLGHHSVTITERYAHLAGTALSEAAREHRLLAASSGLSVEKAAQNARRSDSGNGSESHHAARIPAPTEAHGRIVARLHAAVMVRDERAAWRAARELAAAVMADRSVTLAAQVLAGGDHAIRAALDLADLVTASSPSRPALPSGSRGRGRASGVG